MQVPKGHPGGVWGVGHKCRVWWESKVFCALQLLPGRYGTSGVGNGIAMEGGEALPGAEVYGLTWTKSRQMMKLGALLAQGASGALGFLLSLIAAMRVHQSTERTTFALNGGWERGPAQELENSTDMDRQSHGRTWKERRAGKGQAGARRH